MTALRVISLVLVALVGIVILRNPEWTDASAGWIESIGLAIVLVGLIGAAAYGFGHLPEGRVLQFVQSPKVAWPAMLVGLIVITAKRLF
jgi:hypothetical protein